jgi:hypothetical protein
MKSPASPLKRGLCLCLAAICMTSCTVQSRYSPLGRAYPPRPENSPVEIFQTGAPTRPFDRVSRLDVHLEKTHFVPSSFDDARPELEKQARLSGSDAIIDIRESRSSLNETRIYHVTATGIRYKDSR